MKATEAYIQAFDSMVWAIRTIAAYTDNLVVVYIPGNHDRLSSFHLVHALSKAISADHITWDIEYSERKVHVWHDNFNAFEHGDAVSKNTPIVYATEYPEEWGETKNRTLFTGHFHQNKKIEYITTSETAGFIHKTLPSLSKTDYYHYHKKYVGNRRSGKLELQSPFKGNICELTSTPE
jgi:DNA repair exonuclease SbcCD nuclease subunit